MENIVFMWTKTMKINTTNLTDIEIYNLVLSGKLKRFPNYFWEKPNSLGSAKEITKYLIEDLLKWKDDDIKKNLCQNTFIDLKLNGMLQRCFNGSPYSALNNAYKDKFKQWEISNTPLSFWTKEKAFESIKWLLEKKLKLTDFEIKEKYSRDFIINNGLCTAVKVLKEDAFTIINTIYPERFKAWEFTQTPIGYWDDTTVGEAIRWLIEDVLNWSDKEVVEKLTVSFLEVHGLSGLITYAGKKKLSIYKIMDLAYPGKYTKKQLINARNPQSIKGAIKNEIK